MYNGKVINYYTNEPMANIQVSNGLDIVYTDSNGFFSLPYWEKAHVINVNVLTKCHDDWYINIDGHEGDYNFKVKPVENKEEFSFLHISDTEIEGRESNEWIEFIKDTVKKEKPLFFINTGDLCRDDGLKRSYLLMNSENTGCTVRYAIGNHDMCDGYGEKLFEKYYGPTWFSFDLGKMHFIVLNKGTGDTESGYTKAERLNWLEKDLNLTDNSKGIVIFCHYFNPDSEGDDHTVEEITKAIGEKSLKALIFGHIHSNFVCEYENFIAICSNRPDSGGIDSTPAGIRKLNVSGRDITTEYIYNIKNSSITPDDCLWNTNVIGNIEFTSVMENKNSLWVLTNDDGYPQKCGIYKLDIKSGKVLAYIPTNGIKSEGCIEEDKLYAQDTSGTLYCIDTKNAQIKWKAKSKLTNAFYTRAGVVLAKDKIIAGSPSDIHAYDKNTGMLLWTNKNSCLESAAKYIYDEKRNQIIVSRQWLGMYGIDADTGVNLWENTEDTVCRFNNATPLVYNDFIYKAGYTFLGILDAKTGKLLSKYDTGYRLDVCGCPVIDKDRIYIPTATKGVISIDIHTLEHQHTFPTDNTRILTSPYVYENIQTVESTPKIINDKLIFTASDGYIYIYNKNNAVLVRKINVGSPVISNPYIYDNYIIVADFFGNIKKYEI